MWSLGIVCGIASWYRWLGARGCGMWLAAAVIGLLLIAMTR